MVRDGEMAIREMKRLDENIADPGISADIVRLEQVSARIFDEVRTHPEKLPQIRRFLDYYLPTTLKLLNAYDRMSGTGVSGENIDTTLAKVEGMMRTIVAAFEKQLDSLYGAEALDISTDITVLENMMAREGLVDSPLKAEPDRGRGCPSLFLFRDMAAAWYRFYEAGPGHLYPLRCAGGGVRSGLCCLRCAGGGKSPPE